jgi:hypothetical protein
MDSYMSRQIHATYTKLTDDYTICFYCGTSKVQSIDHVPSVFAVETLGSTYFSNLVVPLLKVACCSSCNSTLSSKPLYTVKERLQHLYSLKLKKLNRMNFDWSEGALKQFGPTLRGKLRDKMKAKHQLIKDVTFMQKQIEALSYENRLDLP